MWRMEEVDSESELHAMKVFLVLMLLVSGVAADGDPGALSGPPLRGAVAQAAQTSNAAQKKCVTGGPVYPDCSLCCIGITPTCRPWRTLAGKAFYLC